MERELKEQGKGVCVESYGAKQGKERCSSETSLSLCLVNGSKQRERERERERTVQTAG